MTYRLLIEYDGTDFCGWQRQQAHPTIQRALEDALAVAIQRTVTVIGSGRTDSGVHARAQVAHFSIEKGIDPLRLLRKLNGLLPASIAVLDLTNVPDGFHARFAARQRRYRYYVSTVPRALDRNWRLELRQAPDFTLMNQAAVRLVGAHDFSAFCRTQSETTNRLCNVRRVLWEAGGRPGDWYLEVTADRFLHGMVRTIVGTLLEIGRGKRPADDIERILNSRDRREAGPAVPPHGLVLEEVSYDEASQAATNRPEK